MSNLSASKPEETVTSALEGVLSRLKNLAQEQSHTLSSIDNKLNIVLNKRDNKNVDEKGKEQVKPHDKIDELNKVIDNLQLNHNWLMTLNNHLSEIV